MTLYFASGITSNFIMTAFISKLSEYLTTNTIYATVRDTESSQALILKDMGIKFISKDDSLNDNFSPARILWFSTHNDPDLVKLYAKKAPTLVISSAAIMDFYIDPSKLEGVDVNSYAYGKYVMSKVPGVHVFVPGFYIEDVGFTNDDKGGLHSESTKIIFGNDKNNYNAYFNSNINFDWGKAYSVTPKSYLISVIQKWLDDPARMQINVPIIICSDRVYRRYELRAYAEYEVPMNDVKIKGLDLQIQEKNIYGDFYHVDNLLTHQFVINSCINAKNQFLSKL